jgi:hypothetical protein
MLATVIKSYIVRRLSNFAQVAPNKLSTNLRLPFNFLKSSLPSTQLYHTTTIAQSALRTKQAAAKRILVTGNGKYILQFLSIK